MLSKRIFENRIFSLIMTSTLCIGIFSETSFAQQPLHTTKKNTNSVSKKVIAPLPKNNYLPKLGSRAPSDNSNSFDNFGPLPTPNTIENILQTPTPEIIKSVGSAIARNNIKYGCGIKSNDMSSFLKRIPLKDDAFGFFFDTQVPDFIKNSSTACLPYAVSLGDGDKVQSFSILSDNRRDKNTTIITVEKSPTTGSYIVETQKLGNGFSQYLEVTLRLNDVIFQSNKGKTEIPPELVWELASIVKEIYPKNINSDNSFLRVVYDSGDKNQWAQIVCVEILDSSQKIVLADAFWVARDDIPGGFFTSYGSELEQNFWTNPLNYTRISRGVGPFASRTTRPKTIRKGNKNIVVMQSYTVYGGHQGIDFAAPPGTPIYAVANGKIIHYGPMSGFGNLVILEHPGNYKTYYAHLSAFNPELEEGSEVRRGLEVGYVGSTGRSTGPHLHFELRKDNVYLNPLLERLELDLWSLRPLDQEKLTKQIVLFASPNRTY